MDATIVHALEQDQLIDITTTGRKSGRPHRIEIMFHYLDEAVYISGLPGRRDWYANLLQNPELVFHLKQSTRRDLRATARPITEPEERRRILAKVAARWDRTDQLEAFAAHSPLVEVRFLESE